MKAGDDYPEKLGKIRERAASGKPLSLGDRKILAAAAEQARANIRERKGRKRS